MEVFKACLKQLQLTQKNLESHRGDGRDTEREKQREPLNNPLTQTQRDELLELKRMAQKELEAQARINGGPPDKYLTEYIESLNQLLQRDKVTKANPQSQQDRENIGSF